MQRSGDKVQRIAIVLLLTLAGMSVVCFAQTPTRHREVTDVTTPSTSTQVAGYYALIIGISKYKYLPQLDTPGADATAVEKILRERYGFQTKMLLDVGRHEILDAFALYRRTLPENSNLLIYYAGHGKLDAQVDEAYWLPVDAQGDNSFNWISADDITRGVRGIPSKHVLVISDSCYSGAILGDGSGFRGVEGKTVLENSAYLSNLQSRLSKDWMASGSREPVEDGMGHSVFAAALFQGLTEISESQFAATDLFYRYVRRKVGGNSRQLPQYGSIRESGDQLGDFIFSRTGAAALMPIVPTPAIEIPIVSPARVANNAARDLPALDSGNDQQKINDVLHQYELAYNSKNADALWKIWPSAPIERQQPIESYFRNAQSIHTVLQMETPQITADHITAVVKGKNTVSYIPRAGSKPPDAKGSITFTLKNNGSGEWTIAAIDFGR